jgi:NitT/TauT family transport system substrate-binding protein
MSGEFRALVACLLLALVVATGCSAPGAPGGGQPQSQAQGGTSAAAPAASGTPSDSARQEAPAGAASTAGAPPPLSPPVPVRVATLGLVGEAGVYITLGKGYFKEEGLDVQLVQVGVAADQVALLVNGDLDYGQSPPAALLYNVTARNVGLKVVSNASIIPQTTSLASGFAIRNELLDSGAVKSPSDLKGRTIALPSAANTTEVYVDRLMAQGGLTYDDVNITVIPGFPDMVGALKNGAVDGAFLVEPFFTVAEAQGIARLTYPISQIYPGASAYALLVGPRFAQEQREAANRFMAAYLRGQRDFYRAFVDKSDVAGQEPILGFLREYTAFKDVKDTPVLLRAAGNTVDPNNDLLPEVWRESQDFFVKRGSVPTPVDINQLLDASYTDYALSRLGRYQ